jgi:hypothetical protein
MKAVSPESILPDVWANALTGEMIIAAARNKNNLLFFMQSPLLLYYYEQEDKSEKHARQYIFDF